MNERDKCRLLPAAGRYTTTIPIAKPHHSFGSPEGIRYKTQYPGSRSALQNKGFVETQPNALHLKPGVTGRNSS